MRLFAQAFWLPKAGNTEKEYEDAFCPRRLDSGQETEARDFRVAVADGATETSFSGLWAKQLVRAYTKGELLPGGFSACLHKLQVRWRAIVNGRTLAWYAEEKARSGAAAAFLGLHLQDTGAETHRGCWEALALGDCCLVQMRGERVMERFPIQHSSDFANSVFLLSSNPSQCEGWPERLRTASGYWAADDRFYLMSDALAAWFMREDEGGSVPWDALRDLGTADSPVFSEWVRELRSKGALRNDDVTLLRIDMLS